MWGCFLRGQKRKTARQGTLFYAPKSSGLAVDLVDREVDEVAAEVVFGEDGNVRVLVDFGVDFREPVVGRRVVHCLDAFGVAGVVAVDVLVALDALDGADVGRDHAFFPAGGGDDSLAREGFVGSADNGFTDVVDEDVDAFAARVFLDDLIEGVFCRDVLLGVVSILTEATRVVVEVAEEATVDDVNAEFFSGSASCAGGGDLDGFAASAACKVQLTEGDTAAPAPDGGLRELFVVQEEAQRTVGEAPVRPCGRVTEAETRPLRQALIRG